MWSHTLGSARLSCGGGMSMGEVLAAFLSISALLHCRRGSVTKTLPGVQTSSTVKALNGCLLQRLSSANVSLKYMGWARQLGWIHARVIWKRRERVYVSVLTYTLRELLTGKALEDM